MSILAAIAIGLLASLGGIAIGYIGQRARYTLLLRGMRKRSRRSRERLERSRRAREEFERRMGWRE
jgi:membrane protein DedA with SNARE-associated domain